jgi:L-alanine-DL-glutamate epimerase-like enolase superfamily enzyme
MSAGRGGAKIERLDVAVFTIPTDAPEADGTIEWNSTTLVLAAVTARGATGIGYTYAHAAAAELIADPLRSAVVGCDAFDIPAAWERMNRSLRNIGRPGCGLMAIAAVDHALWDLKARLLGVPVVDLLGALRTRVPAYGSGGFTSYEPARLQDQLGRWAAEGFAAVKMKVGSDPSEDPRRVHAARAAIGDAVGLMVDANGAYGARQALAIAESLAGSRVIWFEEPVSSDDLEGLAWLRDRVPAPMAIAAGEYGWDDWYFRRMLDACAVDVLQVDSTRCGGFTGFLRAAAIARAHGIRVSAHCAPALHAHVCAAVANLEHVEYFHDHARIESLLFDGVPTLRDGELVVDRACVGFGLRLKEADARHYRAAA